MADKDGKQSPLQKDIDKAFAGFRIMVQNEVDQGNLDLIPVHIADLHQIVKDTIVELERALDDAGR